MGRQKVFAQRDLFATAKPVATLPPEVARRHLPLLEQLLLEVMTTEIMAAEGGGEQDHASLPGAASLCLRAPIQA